jgi:putative heme iron utilization protein
MPYALDKMGRPLLLISRLAMHTQNLEADQKASLLVVQADWSGDPLAASRLTLMGQVVKLNVDDAAEARTAYLAAHQRAKHWVDFDDFSFWRLDLVDIYFVGGFAAMGWVTTSDYTSAEPDPLADVAAGIAEHMNRDHADALVTYARYYADESPDEATMVSLDRLGFKLRLREGDRVSTVRIAFPAEVRTANRSREVLIEMLGRASGAG